MHTVSPSSQWKGRFLPEDVDHIDRDPANNAWANLRKVSRGENLRNRTSYSSTGFKGVYRHKKRFIATLKQGPKSLYLGYFEEPEPAYLTYCAALYALGLENHCAA